MNLCKLKLGVLLLAAFPLLSIAKTETITASVRFLTNQGAEAKEVNLTVIGNRAYFEGDIFVGYVNESGQLVESLQPALSKNIDGLIQTRSVAMTGSQ